MNNRVPYSYKNTHFHAKYTVTNRNMLNILICVKFICVCGPGYHSRYSDLLRVGRFGDLIPVGAKFSAPVQTGPGPNPASYTMGTGSFQAVKRPGRGVDHPPHLEAKLKKE